MIYEAAVVFKQLKSNIVLMAAHEILIRSKNMTEDMDTRSSR